MRYAYHREDSKKILTRQTYEWIGVSLALMTIQTSILSVPSLAEIAETVSPHFVVCRCTCSCAAAIDPASPIRMRALFAQTGIARRKIPTVSCFWHESILTGTNRPRCVEPTIIIYCKL
jgi:hypothetical protein